MSESEDQKGRIRSVVESPVTWGWFSAIGLPSTAIVVTIWLWHESAQDIRIAEKADKDALAKAVEPIAQEVKAFRLEFRSELSALWLKLITEVRDGRIDPAVIGQLQSQEQNVIVSDMIGEAIREEFHARRQLTMKQFPPCVIGESDELRQPWDVARGQGAAVDSGNRPEAGSGRCTVGGGGFSAIVQPNSSKP